MLVSGSIWVLFVVALFLKVVVRQCLRLMIGLKQPTTSGIRHISDGTPRIVGLQLMRARMLTVGSGWYWISMIDHAWLLKDRLRIRLVEKC